MSTAKPHGTDNGHSASIQIDPTARPVVPSTTAGAPSSLPPHRQHFNGDDDENRGENDPLLGGSNNLSGRQRQQGRNNEPTPRWQKALKWGSIFVGVVLILGLAGLGVRCLFNPPSSPSPPPTPLPPRYCKVTDSDQTQLVYTFDPEQYKELFFHLDKDMVGDIYVRQYDSPEDLDEGKVRIIVQAAASDSKMLQATTLNAIEHPRESSLEANVYLKLHDEEREDALRSGCVVTSIMIVFPWNMTRFESLKIQNRNKGYVDVWLPRYNEDGSHDGILRSHTAKDTRDHINHARARARARAATIAITEALKAVSEQGRIFCDITAEKRVELESKLSTQVNLDSSSNYPELDLKVSAETTANIWVESYYGHVELTTWTSFVEPQVTCSHDTFVQQTKTLQTVAGYFSYPNGTEPKGPFPRVKISGEQATFHSQL
ncbi:hypothetical protein BGZ97_012496 [Linnemannia gamsii]|uniref:Uncharacterized protein n=1 Tax=Linnemannia gamsii TaxID=64522 RepID=A0A9P6R575_9FUNG|nr:hypothetical protein BGZ97_012496 [Linnemannia gamsii]